MYIPYNANRLFQRPSEEVLMDHHINPDDMRYELHRVWVIEARLAEGKRLTTPYGGSYFTLAVKGDEVVVGGMRGNAYRSSDKGETWHKTELPLPVSLITSLPVDDGSAQGRLLLANQAGQILIGADMGRSITALPLAPLPPVTLLERLPDGSELVYADFSDQLEAVRTQYQNDDLAIHITGFAKIIGDLIEGLREVLKFFAIAIAIAIVFWYTRCARSTLLLVTSSLVAVVWQLGLIAAYSSPGSRHCLPTRQVSRCCCSSISATWFYCRLWRTFCCRRKRARAPAYKHHHQQKNT
jgi:hypothetical protein